MVKLLIKHKIIEFSIDVLFRNLNKAFNSNRQTKILGKDLNDSHIGLRVTKIGHTKILDLPDNTFLTKIELDADYDYYTSIGFTPYCYSTYYSNDEHCNEGVISSGHTVYLD